jgi:hypothetical protein
LVAIALVFSAVFVALALLEPNDFARGLLLGAGLATVGCLLCFFVLMHDGSYTWRRGAEAEQATADLLERTLPGWDSVHGLFLVSADIDHVIIGPGGVVAVETKWTSVDWESRRGRTATFRAALVQSQQSASRLQRFLASKGAFVDVPAMLVVWGRGAPRFAKGIRRIDDVLVVEGRANPDLGAAFPAVAGFDMAGVLRTLQDQR